MNHHTSNPHGCVEATKPQKEIHIMRTFHLKAILHTWSRLRHLQKLDLCQCLVPSGELLETSHIHTCTAHVTQCVDQVSSS